MVFEEVITTDFIAHISWDGYPPPWYGRVEIGDCLSLVIDMKVLSLQVCFLVGPPPVVLLSCGVSPLLYNEKRKG